MKKAEVLKYCKEKAKEGYLAHPMLLEIYNDTEEIPDEMVNLICHLPEPLGETMMPMSLELYNAFQQVIEDYWDSHQQAEHAKDSFKKVSKS